MQDDLISRQAVMDALCDGCELFKNGEQTCYTKCEEYHFLATLPPVTPQPKYGKWIDGKCNKCGTHAPFWSMATTYYCSEYCPNCGAKMQAESDIKQGLNYADEDTLMPAT